jgi:hypothetical protein
MCINIIINRITLVCTSVLLRDNSYIDDQTSIMVCTRTFDPTARNPMESYRAFFLFHNIKKPVNTSHSAMQIASVSHDRGKSERSATASAAAATATASATAAAATGVER